MVALERLQAGETTFIIAHRPSMVQDGRIEDPLALS